MQGLRRLEPVDRLIAAVARRQHGVIGREQLLELGLGAGAVDSRIATGRLHVVERGVYAVGHRALTREARWMAAVLASGPGAVLSHRSAGALWGISAEGPSIEVTAERSRGQRRGIRLHYPPTGADEITTRAGIRVTGVARTLLDLAAVVDERRLRRAFREVEFKRLTDSVRVVDLLERYPRRRGAPAIRAALAVFRPGEVLKSDLEELFGEFVDRHGLPRPESNVEVAGFERDCVWREQRLIVELDSRLAHASPLAFEMDRARDRAAVRAGWRVIRVTWRQLHQEPDALATDIRGLLAGR